MSMILRKMNLVCLTLCLFVCANIKPIASRAQGSFVHIPTFTSSYTSTRKVTIWLPPNYTNQKKYAVLYMHDGQMIFSNDSTWNHQSWNVHAIAQRLMLSDSIPEIIIVGIWNSGPKRHIDYFPEKPFNYLSKKQKNKLFNAVRSNGNRVFSEEKIQSDNYLKFIVNELKPYIDSAYSTNASQASTCIMGSSMGGLISLYAICEYPTIFGGAACLSTHWPGIFQLNDNPIPNCFFKYLNKKLPNPKNHRIYFDYGNKTLDSLYPTLQAQADKILIKKGYNSKNWKTIFFEHENHSELAWQKRVHIPLFFLFGNKNKD